MKILKTIKISHIAMAMACALLFSSCQSKAIKNISTEIVSGDGTALLAGSDILDFYFYYPENFYMQRDDAMITVCVNDDEVLKSKIADPASGESLAFVQRPNLSATVFVPEGSYATIDDYWQNYAFLFSEEIFNIEEKYTEEDLEIDGMQAKKYTYTYSLAGMRFKVSYIVCFRKNRVYSLIYTATESKYEKYVNVLNTAAETFKFK